MSIGAYLFPKWKINNNNEYKPSQNLFPLTNSIPFFWNAFRFSVVSLPKGKGLMFV
jgi:hypothetical protein